MQRGSRAFIAALIGKRQRESLGRVRSVLIMQFLHKQAGTLASFLPFSISMAICFENMPVIFILSLLEVGD
jgi:hypothetical protein